MRFITTLSDLKNLSLLKSADGILIGEKKFSCRMPAYFSRSELIRISHECHRIQLKCYLNVNRFINEADLDQLREFLEWIASTDIDGLYFNDLAVQVDRGSTRSPVRTNLCAGSDLDQHGRSPFV